MIYRNNFNGMAKITNEATLFFSVDIPINYKSRELARASSCSIRFETDENKKIVLKIYEDYKPVATVYWEDRAKYNYHQSKDINCGNILSVISAENAKGFNHGYYHSKSLCRNYVPEYEKSWDEVFGTFIKTSDDYSQIVVKLALWTTCLDENYLKSIVATL